MWRDWNSHTLLVGRSSGTASLEKAWRLLKWLNTEPHDPAIPLLEEFQEK